MKVIKLKTVIFIILNISTVKCQSFEPIEALENFYPFYSIYRVGLMAFLGRTSENTANLNLAKKMNMLQKEIPASVPFPCNTTGFRSEKPPSTVHQVRPGDIDVIGALGDSLTAGSGLVATNILQILMENRGLSWSIGGQGTWRQYTTLPNILKMFNPNLVGYSLGDSFADERISQFNPAEGTAISSEIPYMAKVLIKRITRDARVNNKEHWKLITIMIGANDFCIDICFKPNLTAVLDAHRKDLIEVLTTLRDHLPRTIINLVPPPQLKAILELKNGPEICRLFHRMCFCLYSLTYQKHQQDYFDLISAWQKLEEQIANMPEFHTEDFTVVFQPLLKNIEIPKLSEDTSDFSYLSQDCFHLSQKTHAKAAVGLWNNMLERVGHKSTHLLSLSENFLCPTKENPYIFTIGNSNN